MDENIFIYGLKDPRTDEFFYVGKTNSPSIRLGGHLQERGNNDKFNRITSIVEDGLQPEMVILEKVGTDNWPKIERDWISQGKAKGWPLVNISSGGGGKKPTRKNDGMEYYFTDEELTIYDNLDKETRYKISSAITVKMLQKSRPVMEYLGNVDEYIPGEEMKDGAHFATKLLEAYGTERFTSLIDTAYSEYHKLVGES